MASPVNGHAANYGLLDRIGLLFSPGRLEQLLGERRAPPPAGPAILTAAAPAAPETNLELAEVLSPSQSAQWTECTAAWYFKYFRGLPDRRDGNRAMGSAVHKALLEGNFRQKIQSRKDLDREQVLNIYAEAWQAEAKEAVFAADEDPAELERAGAVLMQKFLLEAAPEIQPALVEHPVSGTIGGVRARGYVDLMDTNGCILELKTAAKKPSGIRPRDKFQLATYRQICPGASGRAQIKTLVKTKTPQLHSQPYEVSAADIRLIETVYPQVQAAARSGIYIPHRNSMFCSKSGCAFAEACMAEFGGTVED